MSFFCIVAGQQTQDTSPLSWINNGSRRRKASRDVIVEQRKQKLAQHKMGSKRKRSRSESPTRTFFVTVIDDNKNILYFYFTNTSKHFKAIGYLLPISLAVFS